MGITAIVEVGGGGGQGTGVAALREGLWRRWRRSSRADLCWGPVGWGIRYSVVRRNSPGPDTEEVCENHQRMKGTLGSCWRGGQRPDGNRLSTLTGDVELSPEGAGILRSTSLWQSVCWRGLRPDGGEGKRKALLFCLGPLSTGAPAFLYCRASLWAALC